MWRCFRAWLILMLLTTSLATADDAVLPLMNMDIKVRPEHMVLDYFDALRKPLHAKRAEAIAALKTPEDVAARARELRAYFVEALGGFPERTPLNARVVGNGMGEGFRYEKILYDSLPGHPVTAVLFLPLGEGPHPGVLVPCGHSENGKASELYQRACILLARHGIAALIYDPIGQGERRLYHEDGIGPTMQHTLADIACMLTGTNLVMYHIWDGMRGLDYLESRTDIDGKHLGCTGNSGGGTLTSYLMALDDRIVAAAPSCYLTTFDHLLSSIGPQDAEQNIFGQLARGMDHADYLLMRAPKPTLMCVATKDFFPVDGARATYDEAKAIYTLLGQPENVAKVEAEEKHGFSTDLRVGAVNWMRRWLLNEVEPITDESFSVLTEAEMQCSASGQIYTEPGYRSVLDVLKECAKTCAAARDPEASISKRMALQRPGGISWSFGDERDGRSPGVLQLGPGMHLPPHDIPGAVRCLPIWGYLPKDKPTGAVLYLNDQGKGAISSEPRLAKWLSEGKVVWAADLSGIGETASTEDESWDEVMGADWQDFYRAYLLGTSIVSLRVTDILALQGALETERYGKVELFATGELTVPALHAAKFICGGAERKLSRVTLIGGIPSWQAVIESRRPQRQLMNVVPGALLDYDLPDLAKRLPEGMLDWQPGDVPQF